MNSAQVDRARAKHVFLFWLVLFVSLFGCVCAFCLFVCLFLGGLMLLL